MTVVGVTMVKDEEDIIGHTVSHMLTQVDALVVADNLSTDSTREILVAYAKSNPDRMLIVEDAEVAYRQAQKMTALSHMAHEQFGAEWIVPFDADELWIHRDDSDLGGMLMSQPANRWTVSAALFDYVATGQDDESERNPVQRLKWRMRNAGMLPKLAFRWAADVEIEQGNHYVKRNNRRIRRGPALIHVAHFPYRSPEQMLKKVRNGADAYEAGDIPTKYGNHWRAMGALLDEKGPDAIIDLFFERHFRADPSSSKTSDGTFRPSLVREPVVALEADA